MIPQSNSLKKKRFNFLFHINTLQHIFSFVKLFQSVNKNLKLVWDNLGSNIQTVTTDMRATTSW